MSVPRTEGWRRLRLAGPGSHELAPLEAEHALRVLRMEVGMPFEALDGAGRAYRARITRADRKHLAFELEGVLRETPAPGQAGSQLPRIEVAAAIPRATHAEELVQALTQLGAAAWIPLCTERSAPGARELEGHRLERLQRIAGEALKQSGRLWALEIGEPRQLASLLEAGPCLLQCSPHAPLRLCDAVPKPSLTITYRLFFGPEGGFSPSEQQALQAGGAQAVWLAPHILRIETAVAAAVALGVHLWSSARAP